MTTPRRIVVAPDSFKGTIRAADAAAALAAGWSEARPDDVVLLRPMADGGEGTIDAVASAVDGATRVPVRVPGPVGQDVEAAWLRLPATADRPLTGVVELATTSGIELLGDALRPMDAGTRGFGVAIRAALDAGVERLVLAIGSSASSDGGAGMLEALGARLIAEGGGPAAPGARGLESLAAADLTGLVPIPAHGAIVLADVTAPLLGPAGAAATFAPQKGATRAEVARIELALERWAGLLGTDPGLPGSGAAGGTGYALLAWGARLEPGAPVIAELAGLGQALAGADLVVTGEGAFDAPSLRGKVPGAVIAAARDAGVPVALVAGRVLVAPDVARVVELARLAGGVDRAMSDPVRWLREAGRLLAADPIGLGDPNLA